MCKTQAFPVSACFVLLYIQYNTFHLKIVRVCCRIAVHPAAGGAAGPPGAHAGAERPGHVRPHPHQHAVPHQERGKRHCGQ